MDASSLKPSWRSETGANGDMVTLALIQGVVNTFVIFLSRIAGLLFDRLVLRIERGYGPGFWIVSLIMEMVLGVLAMAIVMWFSRWREYRADAGGAGASEGGAERTAPAGGDARLRDQRGPRASPLCQPSTT